MTNSNSIGVSTPYQVLIETKIQEEKAGKKEVSSAVITQLTSKTRSIHFLSKLAVLGLFFLSLTAGISFMLSQRHAQDVSNSRVGQLEKQISVNTELFSKYHKTITANRISSLRAELEAERERVGANHSSANALPLYLSMYLKTDVETVSLWLSGIWVVVLLVTGLSLSALSNLLWSPWHEKRLIDGIIKQIQTKNELNSKLEKLTEKPKQPNNREPKTSQRRSPTFDTGTEGNNSIRYHKVKERIKNQDIKPTVKALRSQGMGTHTAINYLKSMTDEGLLVKVKNRYALV
jgi:hypothetical protein